MKRKHPAGQLDLFGLTHPATAQPVIEHAALLEPHDPRDPWGLAPPGVDPDGPIVPLPDPRDDGERLEMHL